MTRTAQVRLVDYALRPTHYVYRGDMSGKDKDPRTWVLEGSVDGRKWTTLREPPRGRRPRPGFIFHSRAGEHRDDTSVTNTSAGQWPLDGKEFYSHFRVRNCGRPNLLCCSGIDFYGDVVERPGAGAAIPAGASVDSYPNLSARSLRGCYVGMWALAGPCVIIPLPSAFHITPVSDDAFEDCGCADRRGTRASRHDLFMRQVPCSFPGCPCATRAPARARDGSAAGRRVTLTSSAAASALTMTAQGASAQSACAASEASRAGRGGHERRCCF